MSSVFAMAKKVAFVARNIHQAIQWSWKRDSFHRWSHQFKILALRGCQPSSHDSREDLHRRRCRRDEIRQQKGRKTPILWIIPTKDTNNVIILLIILIHIQIIYRMSHRLISQILSEYSMNIMNIECFSFQLRYIKVYSFNYEPWNKV